MIGMNENDIAKIAVDCCYQTHIALGPGLLESVYEEVLAHFLHKNGLRFQRQKQIDIEVDGMFLSKAFYTDLIVEDKVIIEIKSVEAINPVHQKQLLTYLRLTEKKLGLLVNFNEAKVKDGISRIVNNL